MFAKIRYVQLFGLIIYFCVITWLVLWTLYLDRGVLQDGTSPLTNFWNIQFGGAYSTALTDSATMFLYTVFGAGSAIYIKNNSSFYNVQQRIGYYQFLQKFVRNSFFSAAILSIMTKFYELLLIMLVLRRLPSNVMFDKSLIYIPFHDNTLRSWVVFTLLSAIGWGVYAVFIFSIGLFVNKTSVYFVLGTVIGIGILTGQGLVGPILFRALGILSAHFLSLWDLVNLVAPGEQIINVLQGKMLNVYVLFTSSLVIYSFVSFLFIRSWSIKKRKNG